MHGQSNNYTDSKPPFSRIKTVVFHKISHIFFSFLLQLLLPQTNQKIQTKNLTTSLLSLLFLYVGLSLLLPSSVVVYVSVCNNVEKTMDVTTINLYLVHCKY